MRELINYSIVYLANSISATHKHIHNKLKGNVQSPILNSLLQTFIRSATAKNLFDVSRDNDNLILRYNITNF